MTVEEMIEQLTAIDPKLPVLAYWPESGGYINAKVRIVNPDGSRPYVVIEHAR